jgi:hypothetical protein
VLDLPMFAIRVGAKALTLLAAANTKNAAQFWKIMYIRICWDIVRSASTIEMFTETSFETKNVALTQNAERWAR